MVERDEMSGKNSVGIAAVTHLQNKSEMRSELFNLLDQMKVRNNIKITPKADVMVKPNICLVCGYETGATVDPFIIKCLVDWLLQNYDIKTITIGEADATELNVDVAFKVLGWEDTFNHYTSVNSLGLLIEKVGLDAVFVCIPNFLHYNAAKDALEHDLPVFTMKGDGC